MDTQSSAGTGALSIALGLSLSESFSAAFSESGTQPDPLGEPELRGGFESLQSPGTREGLSV